MAAEASVSTAAKAGMGVGIAVGCMVVVGLFSFFVQRRKKRRQGHGC